MPPIVPPLAEVFATIPDFRHARGKRHSLSALLLLACVAMLAGARGQSGIADWAKNYGEPWRTHLGFTHPKGPSQSTVQRVFAHIAVETLEAQLACWAQQVFVAIPPPDTETDVSEGVAMDGKTLRMSARCGAVDAHLLSLCSHRLGLVLTQMAVSDKTNEDAASDDLLATLLLTGVVITADAGALWAGSRTRTSHRTCLMGRTTICSSSKRTSRRCLPRSRCSSPILKQSWRTPRRPTRIASDWNDADSAPRPNLPV